MGKNYGVSNIEKWQFEDVEMPEIWRNHLGEISKPFKMLILGDPKNGKTEYAIQCAKMLAEFYGKVSLNNVEQGRSKTLKLAILRNQMQALAGKFMLCDASKKVFQVWFDFLSSPNSGQVVILDSVDYMELTFAQWKKLTEKHKNKSFIIIAWSNPMSSVTKQIKYQVDIVVDVVDFVATVRSRFGGNKPYVIWEEGAVQAAALKRPQKGKGVTAAQPSLFDLPK